MSVPTFLSKWLGLGRHYETQTLTPVRFRPAVEPLADRLTPANISTGLVLGNLTLTDDGSTGFTISQSGANQITITPAAGTTVNGQAGPLTIDGVTGNLTANLGAGDDTLVFDLSADGISVGNLTVNGSTGNKAVRTNTAGADNFLTVRGNYRQVFGDGTVTARLNQFDVSGNMTISHGNGNSFVFLGVDPANRGDLFNAVAGDLTVNNVTASGRAATGIDVNALEETNVGGTVRADMGNATGNGGWTSFGSLSDESVTVGGDVVLTALTGFLVAGDFNNDGMEVRNAWVAGGVVMDLGKGVGNTALFGGGTSADSTFASSVSITSQGAHATATVGASEIVGDLEVRLTGKGSNSIAVDGVLVTGDTDLTAAGGGSEIAIDNEAPGSTFAGSVDIDMAGKNNLLSINSRHRVPGRGTTTFADVVTADLGGRSTLMLAAIGEVEFGAEATFDGGGRSEAVVNPGNIAGVPPTLKGFN